MNVETMSRAAEVHAVPTRARRTIPINVSTKERWVSVLGGGSLVLWGLGRGNLPGLFAALLGGALVQRGVTGRCRLYGALGVNTRGELGFDSEPERPHGLVEAITE